MEKNRQETSKVTKINYKYLKYFNIIFKLLVYKYIQSSTILIILFYSTLIEIQVNSTLRKISVSVIYRFITRDHNN